MSDNNFLTRIRDKHLSPAIATDESRALSRRERVTDWMRGHRALIGGTLALVLASVGTLGFFMKDYITKRQNFPVRDLLYMVDESIKYYGGEEDLDSKLADRKVVSKFFRHDKTRDGDMLGIAKWTVTDERIIYELEDAKKERFIAADDKAEIVQGGLRLRGGINFTRLGAEIIGTHEKFVTYAFIPERGHENRQLNIVVGKDGKRKIVDELVTLREYGLGWAFGPRYRRGTQLFEFPQTDQNKRKIDALLKTIDTHETSKEEDPAKREALINKALEGLYGLDRIPVYSSHEDGIIDLIPQESSIYLFSDPTLLQRLWPVMPVGANAQSVYPDSFDAAIGVLEPMEIKNPGNDVFRIRVENHWDLFPGWIPGLRGVSIGEHPNILTPFNHENNGGYTIEDGRGVIARIDIQDYIWRYGEDVLHNYFLDKNGNGSIDEKTELIGRVLFRTSHDESPNIERAIGKGKEKKNVTQHFEYAFMAGADWEHKDVEFYLCNAIESLMADQVNRGFGKHSVLGEINNQRSSILLLREVNIPNLARALTVESSLVAKYDIVALFRAAGREYVEQYVK